MAIESKEKVCPICQMKFKYIPSPYYEPPTCRKFECVFAYNHGKAIQHASKMKNE